jgi:hypothetical protein
MAKGEDTANHPNRRVGVERFNPPQLFMRDEQSRKALGLGTWSNEGGQLVGAQRYVLPPRPPMIGARPRPARLGGF